MAGVPLAVIAEALGHADERITRKHYAHLSPSYVRHAVRTGLGALGVFHSTELRLVESDPNTQEIDSGSCGELQTFG
jgi:hypothetical protein